MIALDKAPYPGLRPFERDESHLFFGRDDCVDTLIQRLAGTRFLAVLGSSGTGKSSLVKTGLLAGLEMGLLQGAGARWRIVDFRPGAAPLANLARRLLETATDAATDRPVDPAEVDDLRTRLAQGGPRALIEWCRAGQLARGSNLLLLVDQFEELFRFKNYAEREEAQAFVSLLLESRRPIEVDSPQMAEFPIYVTITMRSEFLGYCALIDGLAQAINEGTYLTPRMTRQECRDAVVGPARVCGVDIGDILVTRILNDLANFAPWEERGARDEFDQLARRADQLPLMQHALNQMWQRARKRQLPGQRIALTADDYHGLEKELDDHAEQVLGDLGEPLRPVAETVFRAVTSGTTVSNAVRRPTRFGELVAICGGEDSRHAVVEVIAAFGPRGCQFLTSDVPLGGPQIPDDAIIDISHESLIRQWKRLSKWVEDEGELVHEWQRLDEEARHSLASHPPQLLGGKRLNDATALRDRTGPTPAWASPSRANVNLEQVDLFINRSRKSARRRLGLKFFGAALVAAAVIYGVHLQQENEQKDAVYAATRSKNVELEKLAVQLRDERDRNDGYRQTVFQQGREIEKLAIELLQTYRESKREMTTGGSSQSEKLREFQARYMELAGLFSATEHVFNTAGEHDRGNKDLMRPHLITLALLSLLRTEPYSEEAKRQRQQAYELARRLEEMNLDFDSVRTIYVSLTSLSLVLSDDRRYDEAIEALGKIIPVVRKLHEDRALAPSEREDGTFWLSQTWYQMCEVMKSSGKLDEAIDACSNTLILAKTLPSQRIWDLASDTHATLNGMLAQRIDELEKGSRDPAVREQTVLMREKAIGEMRASLQLVYSGFEAEFAALLEDFATSPDNWPVALGNIGRWWKIHGLRIRDWMAESNPAFALKRSEVIALRVENLADLYEKVGKLGEARVAHLMQVIYRYNLAARDEIEQQRRAVLGQISVLQGGAAKGLLSDGKGEAEKQKTADELANLETESKAADDLKIAQAYLLDYDDDAAAIKLGRALRDLGYFEGDLPRQAGEDRPQAGAEQPFLACIDVIRPLLDQGRASSGNQEAMGQCYSGLGWVKQRRSAACDNKYVSEKIKADTCDSRIGIELLTGSREAYLTSVDLLEKSFADNRLDRGADLIRSLDGLADLTEVKQKQQRNDREEMKKAISEAATYRKRAVEVADEASDRCRSASARGACEDTAVIDKLAVERSLYGHHLMRLGNMSEVLGLLEAAIRLKKNDPLSPRDFDELVMAINFAHALMFNGDFERAKAIYLAAKDISFDGPRVGNSSGLGNIKSDFAEFESLGVIHPGMCLIGKLIDDDNYAKATCQPIFPAAPGPTVPGMGGRQQVAAALSPPAAPSPAAAPSPTAPDMGGQMPADPASSQ